MIRTSLLVATILLGVAFVCPPLAYAQDFGVPDTVRYLPPEFQIINCNPTVQIKLPIYVYSDYPAQIYYVHLQLSASGEFDTASAFPLAPCGNLMLSTYRDDSARIFAVVLYCSGGGSVTPGQGTAMEYFLSAAPGDSIHISATAPTYFLIGDGFFWWYPVGTTLDTSFVVPDSFEIDPGDCDCSGFISVSDAVFLIQYIFGGGEPPYDLNSADPNSDCIVSISDVVFLVNYIFTSGPAPSPGCITK